MDFIPDVSIAKKGVQKDVFFQYSMAYVVTNENLRESMQFMPVNRNQALVVAASGDHPLYCSLYGAKHVDTFDISYNAKCIMDIKTSAMKSLTHSEYINLLRELSETRNVKDVPNMDKISKFLPPIEWKYLCEMNGYRLFSNSKVTSDKFLVSNEEYEKLQEIVEKPYNFIMTDLASLSAHLTKSYDFIHLSNILDYVYDQGNKFFTIYPLLKHVNVGGRIICYQMIGESWLFEHPIEYFQKALVNLKDGLKDYGFNLDKDMLKIYEEDIIKVQRMCDSEFKNWNYKVFGNVIAFERIR